MSAITGIYHLDGQHFDSSILNKMAKTLAHRSPDGSDIWQAGSIGLGHGMLWTTAESLHEHLPLTSDDGMFTITADARIDNRDELISDLNLDQQSGTLPDSTLILHAYQNWGESCVDHLLGDFTFAIWDQHNQYLFCARDHMGVKPLYYFRSDEFFAFASEIKALFCVPGIPREINEKALAFRLAGFDYEPEITTYLHICRLPAAHTMIVSQSGTRIHRYWALDPHREIHFETDEEYENAFRTLFAEAVRCRMRSVFPIGSELSGGLDSSSVVCVARYLQHEDSDIQHSPIHTFSSVFDQVPESDERHYINQVLAGGDLVPHFIYPDQMTPLYDLEQRIRQNEELSLPVNSYTFWILYKAAKDTGVRIVLNGEFGDIIVSHWSRVLIDFAFSGKILRLIKEIMNLSKNFGFKKREIIWRHLIVLLIPFKIRWRFNSNPIKWIREDFARRTGLTEFDLHYREADLKLKTSREYHFFDLTSLPISLILEACDKNDAAYSIEPRYPFLDRRVVEFCLALPPEQRIRNGYTRAIVRDALAQYLPPEIRHRTTKAYADSYVTFGLVKFEAAGLKDYLLCNPDLLGSYVDLDFIREAYHKLMAGSIKNLNPLWRTIVLAFWLQEENRIRLSNSKDKKIF